MVATIEKLETTGEYDHIIVELDLLWFQTGAVNTIYGTAWMEIVRSRALQCLSRHRPLPSGPARRPPRARGTPASRQAKRWSRCAVPPRARQVEECIKAGATRFVLPNDTGNWMSGMLTLKAQQQLAAAGVRVTRPPLCRPLDGVGRRFGLDVREPLLYQSVAGRREGEPGFEGRTTLLARCKRKPL